MIKTLKIRSMQLISLRSVFGGIGCLNAILGWITSLS